MDVTHTHYLSLEFITTVLLAAIPSLLGSVGFWAWIDKRQNKRGLSRELLIGLAHDRIVQLCMCYISQGYITSEEYENLHVYLYKPYIMMGANGSAQRLMAEVDKLPIVPKNHVLEKEKNDDS